MSEKIQIQYVGFHPGGAVREYTFRVLASSKEPGESREFILTISNDAFLSRRARYQDGPDICFAKLHSELVEEALHPVTMRSSVSDQDLENYREAHSSKNARKR